MHPSLFLFLVLVLIFVLHEKSAERKNEHVKTSGSHTTLSLEPPRLDAQIMMEAESEILKGGHVESQHWSLVLHRSSSSRMPKGNGCWLCRLGLGMHSAWRGKKKPGLEMQRRASSVPFPRVSNAAARWGKQANAATRSPKPKALVRCKVEQTSQLRPASPRNPTGPDGAASAADLLYGLPACLRRSSAEVVLLHTCTPPTSLIRTDDDDDTEHEEGDLPSYHSSHHSGGRHWKIIPSSFSLLSTSLIIVRTGDDDDHRTQRETLRRADEAARSLSGSREPGHSTSGAKLGEAKQSKTSPENQDGAARTSPFTCLHSTHAVHNSSKSNGRWIALAPMPITKLHGDLASTAEVYFPQLEHEQLEPQLPVHPAMIGKARQGITQEDTNVQLELPEHPHSPFILSDSSATAGVFVFVFVAGV
ncbi:hypothetical protein JHW43_005501 [Diplocarpon mali]|nr:hypothetical protein JHW43_005501 [Diplocarpon mali]